MRKNSRDGIVELISSINEALDYIRGIDYNAASPLIEDCEAAIASILTTIKAQLSDSRKASYHTVLVNLESTIQIFHNVKVFPPKDEVYDNTKRSLSILCKKLLKEEVQYEVVFLPYSATMWDSLESIWLAAKEDPRCIPYVIPIPYYDKNIDGLLEQMHYDGELLPDYVPITNYLQYDFETRNPEIIYFHNPYDKFNKVISVHPMYYSDRLQTYTNMLVYVPYFIVMDDLSEDFAILPGVRYADKVIVQSEQIAEQYKKYYPFEDKDKFLPLGSPKIDKALQMSKLSREELNLPKEWTKLIGEKKVILYNTHIDNIMNRGELLIQKLRYVFSCFENRDDVVLLWRPHPFSDSTAVAMNPDFLESYKQVEREYREKGFGIYDDTPDLHRSLALADAYYGDWSSLVPMFGVSGKPIMIQDVYKNCENDKIGTNYLSFSDAYVDEDDIWFSANEFNGLFHMNLKTGMTVNKAVFPGEDMYRSNLYQKVVKYNNKLFFIPFYAKDMAEYDLSSGEISKIQIDSSIATYRYHTCIIYHDWLYLLPLGNVPCLKYNMNTREMVNLDFWNEELKKYKLNLGSGYSIFSCAYLLKGKIYAPMGLDHVLFEFDLLDDTIIIHKIGQHSGYTDIQHDGENFWLLPREKAPVLQWNPETKDENYFKEYYFDFEIEKIPFITCVVIDEAIWLFSRKSPQAIKLNINNIREMEKVNFEIKNYGFDFSTEYFSKVVQKNEHEIIAFAGSSKQIIFINKNTNAVRTIPVITDEKLLDENLNRYLSTNGVQRIDSKDYLLNESSLIPLTHYIKDIVDYYDDFNHNGSCNDESDLDAGKRIHESIKSFYKDV